MQIVLRNLPAIAAAYGPSIRDAVLAEVAASLEMLAPALAAAHAGTDGSIRLTYLDASPQAGNRMRAHLGDLATGFLVEVDGHSIPVCLDVLTERAISLPDRIAKPVPMLLPVPRGDDRSIRESFEVSRDVIERLGSSGAVLTWYPLQARDGAGEGLFEASACLLSAHNRLVYLYSLKPHLERAGLAFNLDVVVAREALAHLAAQPAARIMIPISPQSLLCRDWWLAYSRTLAEQGLADRVTLMIGRSPEFDRLKLPADLLATFRSDGLGLGIDGLTGDGRSIREIVGLDPDIVRFVIPPAVAADPVAIRKLQQAVGMAVEQGRRVMIDDTAWRDVLPGFMPDLIAGEQVDALDPSLLSPAAAKSVQPATEGAEAPWRWRGLAIAGAVLTSWLIVLEGARLLF